jgi:hypothetical protein
MNQCVLAAVLFSSAIFSGCSADKKADAAQPPKMKEGSVAPRPAVVSASSTPYQVVSVAGAGKVTGTIDFDGVIPADSIIQLPADVTGCGQRITDQRILRSGTRIGDVVVWITDIRSGKSLPLERRFQLANEDCMLTPRVQAVLAPATLNVVSEDIAIHRDRIINVGTGELEAVAPFNDNGEVVPFDRLLDKTEQLEILCDLHPWAKAHILVFDHPYFAMTDKSGTFSISDVPAGSYHIKAWHPLLGVAEQSVTIAAGQSANLALKLGTPAPVIPATTPAPDSSAK